MKRYSKQRATVLQTVRETDSHPTAEWVFAQVRDKLPKISLGTVYRNLNLLADQGDLLRIYDNRHVRYDGNVERHDHFRCDSCGTIYDLEIQLDGVAEALAQQTDLRITGYSLDMSGICPNCQNTHKGN